MRVLFPFNVLSDFYWHRYQSQIRAIARNVDKLYLTYYKGFMPDTEGNIVFVKIRDAVKHGLGKRILRRGLKAATGLNLMKVYLETDRYLASIPDVEYDLMYYMSGSPINQWIYTRAAENLGIPIVFRFRGDGRAERQIHYTNQYRRRIYDFIDNYTMGRADLIIPIKAEFILELEGRGINAKVGPVIPIGVDAETFRPQRTPGVLPRQFAIGYAGRISKEKGIDFLLDLMEKTPGIKYHMAGMKNLDISEFPENCKYWGVLKQTNMPKFYNHCSIIVLPSDFEGLSNTLLEAYASCRPVIMTREAHPEGFPVYGWELEKDLEKWATLIKYLSKNSYSTEIYKLGLKAREWIANSQYTWDQFGEALGRQFRDLIKEKTEWSKKVNFLQTHWTHAPEIPEYRKLMIDLAAKHLWKHREWHIFEAGSGTGLFYAYLPDKLKARYHGLDKTYEMVEHCRREYPRGDFKQGDILNADHIPRFNIIITQNVLQHITLYQLAMKNLIDKAKDIVIFCERTHEEHTMKVGHNPTRWRFGIDDFLELMRYCGQDHWHDPQIKGHPISTEGLKDVLTVFSMKRRN